LVLRLVYNARNEAACKSTSLGNVCFVCLNISYQLLHEFHFEIVGLLRGRDIPLYWRIWILAGAMVKSGPMDLDTMLPTAC